MSKYNDNLNNKKEDKIIADSFIDSIQEEINKENWQRIWDKYGKLISIAASIIVIGVIGHNVWQTQDLEDREAISASFTSSQNELAAEHTKTALTGFKEIGKSSKHNYAALAKFEEAAILRAKQDKTALDRYKEVFENEKVNSSIKDLAYIYYINTALDLMPEKELETQLPSFISNLLNKYISKSWDILAKETLAYCYLKQGDNEKARKTLEDLARTENIPAGILERTRELIQYISETSSSIENQSETNSSIENQSKTGSSTKNESDIENKFKTDSNDENKTKSDTNTSELSNNKK
ncbi:MAG: tetratricopeptide repeat protein [Alphaproteobacteria bacterium]|nr:tetratricopeptide repeat protein [Alphaproteobacteria bacterium]